MCGRPGAALPVPCNRSVTKVWRCAGILGTASYSVYLIHRPVMSIVTRALKLLSPAISSAVALFAIFAVSVAAGLAYWFFYERPALGILRTEGWRFIVRLAVVLRVIGAR